MTRGCPRCQSLEDKLEALREQVRWYRDELGLVEDLDLMLRFKERLELRGMSEARLLARLNAVYPRAVTKLQLADELYGKEDRCTRTLDVYASRLRKRIGFDGLETVGWGAGYRLTAAGHEKVTAAMARVDA